MHMSLKLTHLVQKPATESWDYYYCLVDNKPAIISVDLNLVETVPDAQLPFLFYVSLKLKSPGSEGFPSPAELSELCKVEDRLLDYLVGKQVAAFCGRVTTNGSRDLIFYVKDVSMAEILVQSALQQFDYTFECGSKDDAHWDFYIDFLFPNERELNAIYNHRYTAELNKAGDCPHQERPVMHTLYFPSADQRDNFILQAIDQFFQVEKIETLPAMHKMRCKVVVSRTDSVDLPSINVLTLQLLDMAKNNQGIYEGWVTTPTRMHDAV